jgi:hypothetical protein
MRGTTSITPRPGSTRAIAASSSGRANVPGSGGYELEAAPRAITLEQFFCPERAVVPRSVPAKWF